MSATLTLRLAGLPRSHFGLVTSFRLGRIVTEALFALGSEMLCQFGPVAGAFDSAHVRKVTQA